MLIGMSPKTLHSVCNIVHGWELDTNTTVRGICRQRKARHGQRDIAQISVFHKVEMSRRWSTWLSTPFQPLSGVYTLHGMKYSPSPLSSGPTCQIPFKGISGISRTYPTFSGPLSFTSSQSICMHIVGQKNDSTEKISSQSQSEQELYVVIRVGRQCKVRIRQ